MSELFGVNVPAINKRVNNIYEDRVLDKISTCQDFRQVWIEGNKYVNRELEFYNLFYSKKETIFKIIY